MQRIDNSDLLGDEYRPATPTPPVLSTQQEARTVVVLPRDPTRMEEKARKQYTQQRIRECFHQLAMGNLNAVQTWLHNVAQDSPAKAVELFIELARFSLPQLRETAVTLNKNETVRTFQSSEEILAELNSGSDP